MVSLLKQKILNLVRRYSSFTYVNSTQFLGAMNDNLYKLLIVYFFIQIGGIENSPTILATTGATFVLPFLIFSSWAGTLADRFSKSQIIVVTKILELVIMLGGLVAFATHSIWGSYVVLFLMAAQSALLSPSKYGILPEIMPSDEITKANGMMTSFTYLAIIFGTFFASFLLDISDKNFIFASICTIIIAIAGVITAFCIQETPPSGSQKKLNPRVVYEVYDTLKSVKNYPSLIPAVLGSSFFLFLAAYMQLNIIPFAVNMLNLTDVQGGYLFLMIAIGIGTGAILAGKVCGKTAELGLVPIAGVGIAICFFLLDAFSHNLPACIALVITIGVFGGFYVVPLDSYVQLTSPKQLIGQVVASNTFLSFFGVLLASGLLYVVSVPLGFPADKGFVILGVLTVCVISVYTYLFFDYLTRFVGLVLSRLHFKISFNGQDNIPQEPAIYLCTHTAWNDTLLLLGAQRRRMRFFIEHEKHHSKWLLKLYRMLRVVLIPEIEPLEHNAAFLTEVRNTLNKGISVCIFIDDKDVNREVAKLKNSQVFQQIIQDTLPMVLVRIYKGEKGKQVRFFRRLWNKFRVPADVSFEKVDWNTALLSMGSGPSEPPKPSAFLQSGNAVKPKLKQKGLQRI